MKTTAVPMGQNWSQGRLGAPIGTRDWADAVRLKVLAASEHLGESDDDFVGWIELLQDHRAWSLLTKQDGTTFASREEFCAYRKPWGLNRSWRELHPYITAALAKRGMSPDAIDRHLALDGVPEPMPAEESIAGARAAKTQKHSESLRGNGCPSEPTKAPGRPDVQTSTEVSGNDCPRSPDDIPDRTIKQLRAINRAPDAIKDAYKEGRISQTLAAKLGPVEVDTKRPNTYDPDTAALMQAIAEEIRTIPDRKEVDAVVRERLRVPKPMSLRVDGDPAAVAKRLVEKLGADWCEALIDALRAAASRRGEAS